MAAQELWAALVALLDSGMLAAWSGITLEELLMADAMLAYHLLSLRVPAARVELAAQAVHQVAVLLAARQLPVA
jgi:hypothetical protein